MTLSIFLSHSHKDNPWCDELAHELSNYDVDIWYDRQSIYVGEEWFWKIQEELSNRDVFIIVITPDSMASEWVRREIASAFYLKKRIIGIIHQQAPIPPFLATIQTLDVHDQHGNDAANIIALNLKLEASKQKTPPSESTANISGRWIEQQLIPWVLEISQTGETLSGTATRTTRHKSTYTWTITGTIHRNEINLRALPETGSPAIEAYMKLKLDSNTLIGTIEQKGDVISGRPAIFRKA